MIICYYMYELDSNTNLNQIKYIEIQYVIGE